MKRFVADFELAETPLRDLGRWLPSAVVAAEDPRFFDHPGYDLVEKEAALARRLRFTPAPLSKALEFPGRPEPVRATGGS